MGGTTPCVWPTNCTDSRDATRRRRRHHSDTALNLDDISKIKPIAFTIAPAAAVILGKFVLGEEVTTRKWIAVAMILLGVALLTSTKNARPRRGKFKAQSSASRLEPKCLKFEL